MTSLHHSRTYAFQTLVLITFFNGLFASAISYFAVFTSELPETFLGWLYLVLQQFGHFQFFAFLIALPLVALHLFSPLKKINFAITVIVFSLFVCLVFINYEVYKLYRFHLNGMVWNMLTGGGIKEIFVFDAANVTTFSIYFGLVVIAQSTLLYFIHRRRLNSSWSSGGQIFAVVFIAQLVGQSIYAWSDVWRKSDVISQLRFIPLPQPITVKRFLYKQGWAPEFVEETRTSLPTKGHFNYPKNPLQCNEPNNTPNILLIVSDSLRFDMVTPEVMPVWSEFATQSLTFANHLSTGNATRFGMYGLLSGLNSHYWFDALQSKTSPMLFEALKQHNYEFGFFSNARLSNPELDQALLSGVSQFVPKETAGIDVVERERVITQQAQDFIKTNTNKAFFSLVFFDAPHAYAFPKDEQLFNPSIESLNYLNLDNNSDTAPILNRYKNSVHFNDRLTGEILATVEQQGLMDNTIIILTSDHGQEANETKTNSWGHNSNFSKYQIQVPLIIRWPGKQAYQYSHLSSHIDLVPTLLQEVLACNNQLSDYTDGQSLFDVTERGYVLVKNWNDYALVNKNQVHIIPKIGSQELRSYDTYQKLPVESSQMKIDGELMKSLSHFYR